MTNIRAELRADYDWNEAFAYARNVSTIIGGGCVDDAFTLDDVEHVQAKSEGENEVRSWIIYGRLTDGRWFFLEAGCDYTGWDCQADGSAKVAATRAALERYGMTTDDRARLGITLGEVTP